MAKTTGGVVGHFVGDTHTGSTTALAPESRCDNAAQVWLLERWRENLNKLKTAAKGKDLLLFLGGDLVEGRHHGSLQVWGNHKEQRDAAVELLMPLVNLAAEVYAVPGTEAHAGDDGEDDRTVAQELGAKTVAQHQIIDVDGYLLSWAHHGITVGKADWNEDNGMISAARILDDYYARRPALRRPSVVISHHAHRMPRPVTLRDMTVGVCGCWQLPTPHGYKIAPRSPVTIGTLLWTVGDKLERWPYEQEQTITQAKAYRKAR